MSSPNTNKRDIDLGMSIEEIASYTKPIHNPTIAAMKNEAKTLTSQLKARGHSVKHMRVIEAVARVNGFRTWGEVLANV